MSKKNTKRALLSSVLALVLCLAMLTGTTFAWFTDSVTSGKNQIIAGNLDVELVHTNAAGTTEDVQGKTNLFLDKEGQPIKWEPGMVVWENFTVKNAGNLALKYQLSINFSNEYKVNGKGLSDVLKVAVVENGFNGTRDDAKDLDYNYSLASFVLPETLLAGDSDTYGIVIYWEPTDHDNDYNMNNGRTEVLSIDLGIGLFATQVENEKDSFGPDYDAAAPLLPSGVTPEDMEQNNAVAVDEFGNYYTTFTAAIGSGAGTLYLEPGTDLGVVTHLDVDHDVVIYGNGATIDGDLAVEFNTQMTEDTTITIYDVDNLDVWGSRKTAYALTINLIDCTNTRVYINGTAGDVNINMQNCTTDVATLDGDTGVYSNANGDIVLENCTFVGVPCPINLNHKVAGEQNVTVKDCTFIDCATTGTAAYYAPVRMYNSEVGANQTLVAEGNTYTYSEGNAPVNGAEFLLNKQHNGADASGAIVATVKDVAGIVRGANVTLTSVANSTATAQNRLDIAKEGDTILLAAGEYETLTVKKFWDGGFTTTGITPITIKGGEGVTVGAIDLSGMNYVTIDSITFDAAKAINVYGSGGMEAEVGNIVDAGNNTYKAHGANHITIKNCTFTGTPVDASKYVPVLFVGSNISNWTYDVEISGCKFLTNAMNFVRMNYGSHASDLNGTITLDGNTFGGAEYTTGHHAVNATGNGCHWVITDNAFINWNPEKTAFATGRSGEAGKLNFTITGNTFSNTRAPGAGDDGVIEIKTNSYNTANCNITFSGNIFAGALQGLDESTVKYVSPFN